jgi:pSer/pThr/pTyr-binding forkhead associated (FHA) protein
VDATGSLELPTGTTGPLSAVDTGSLRGVAPGTAMLIVRRGPSEGTSFVLDSDVVTVGRADDSSVVLDDVTVSRRHAQVERTDRGWVLRDAGSLNGTYVNHERINVTLLAGGDEVQIGKYRFVFLVGGGQE